MNKNSLLQLLSSSSHCVDPVFLLNSVPEAALNVDAFLFVGKASERFFAGIEARIGRDELRKKTILGIYPKSDSKKIGPWIAAEHPLPGEGSFRAGSALLDFFDSLRRLNARRLTVFLSGGASSRLWLPKFQMTKVQLLQLLDQLLLPALDIGELNAKRTELCQLKGGGAARWLSRLAPQVHAKVFVLSDVAPLGPSVVGSGPFWDGKIPHRVLADNSTWVKALAHEARGRSLRVLHCSSGRLGSWQNWMQTAIQELQPTLRRNKSGVFIFGGEPSVRLPVRKGSRLRAQKGGRQSHLALAIAHHLRPWVLQGRIEILAMSSDGSDGNSGAAGVWMDSESFPKRFALLSTAKVERALREYRSAALLSKLGALVKAKPGSPRSNVQDVLMIRVR